MRQDYICKQNSFDAKLKKCIRNLYETSEQSDVTIVCKDNKKLKCHKFLLCEYSQIFKGILSGVEIDNPTIIIRDASYKNLKSLLEFLYTGETTIMYNDFNDLNKIAKDFQMKVWFDGNGAEEGKEDNTSNPRTFDNIKQNLYPVIKEEASSLSIKLEASEVNPKSIMQESNQKESVKYRTVHTKSHSIPQTPSIDIVLEETIEIDNDGYKEEEYLLDESMDELQNEENEVVDIIKGTVEIIDEVESIQINKESTNNKQNVIFGEISPTRGMLEECNKKENKFMYDCDACGKLFKTKSAKSAHKTRIHSGVKPYKCSKCFKNFKDKKSWWRHEATFHM